MKPELQRHATRDNNSRAQGILPISCFDWATRRRHDEAMPFRPAARSTPLAATTRRPPMKLSAASHDTIDGEAPSGRAGHYGRGISPPPGRTARSN